MSEENTGTNPEIQFPIIEKSTVLKYLKIAALFFILPAWIVIFINETAVLWKTFSWFQQDIAFWNNKKYLILTIIIALIPIIYLVWFYYLAIKKTIIQLNEDFFQNWNIELGKVLAIGLIDLEAKRKTKAAKLEIGLILVFLNKKISKLPKVLAWVARKLIDRIPLVEFINSFNTEDLENENKENLAFSITNRFNELLDQGIDNIVPGWTKYIIPINLALLVWFFKL